MILSIYHTHTHWIIAHEWEKRSLHKWKREQLSEIIFVSLGFTFSIGVHPISKEVVGFSLYGFPKENYLCLLSLLFIAVHVILSNKILRSYCLNDKNLTFIKLCLYFMHILLYVMVSSSSNMLNVFAYSLFLTIVKHPPAYMRHAPIVEIVFCIHSA